MSATDRLREAAEQASEAASNFARIANEIAEGGALDAAGHGAAAVTGIDPFMFRLAIFALACFVGYYVVWSVTPALHTPLMSVT
ncbi:MAG: proton-translocating transhydrogenase family protein, partial [Paracoccaceae bacterium]